MHTQACSFQSCSTARSPGAAYRGTDSYSVRLGPFTPGVINSSAARQAAGSSAGAAPVTGSDFAGQLSMPRTFYGASQGRGLNVADPASIPGVSASAQRAAPRLSGKEIGASGRQFQYHFRAQGTASGRATSKLRAKAQSDDHAAYSRGKRRTTLPDASHFTVQIGSCGNCQQLLDLLSPNRDLLNATHITAAWLHLTRLAGRRRGGWDSNSRLNGGATHVYASDSPRAASAIQQLLFSASEPLLPALTPRQLCTVLWAVACVSAQPSWRWLAGWIQACTLQLQQQADATVATPAGHASSSSSNAEESHAADGAAARNTTLHSSDVGSGAASSPQATPFSSKHDEARQQSVYDTAPSSHPQQPERSAAHRTDSTSRGRFKANDLSFLASQAPTDPSQQFIPMGLANCAFALSSLQPLTSRYGLQDDIRFQWAPSFLVVCSQQVTWFRANEAAGLLQSLPALELQASPQVRRHLGSRCRV